MIEQRAESQGRVPDFDLMTTDDVAGALITSPSTVRYWRHLQIGPPAVKLGRRVLYRRADVLAWIEGKRAAEIAARSA